MEPPAATRPHLLQCVAFTVRMDGNLVIYHPGTVVWAVSESGESKGDKYQGKYEENDGELTGRWSGVDGS